MPTATPPTLATSAYAHACAVLADRRAATEAAILAVRRGGRSPAMVLGHARREALARAERAGGADLDEGAPDDLGTLARALTFTRPAAERALMDLIGRHGLDQGDLGRALGVSPGDAVAQTSEVSDTWQRDLDPVLLARIGAGTCETLAELLDPPVPPDADDVEEAGVDVENREVRTTEPREPTLGQLIDRGAVVAAHAAECNGCGDRLRAMVSVRTLLAQSALEEPPTEVVDAAQSARRRPSGLPDDARAFDVARQRRFVLGAAAAAVVIAIVGGVIVAATRGGDPSTADALAAASTSLGATPDVVDAARTPPITLRNSTAEDVNWTGTADQPWVIVTPPNGSIHARGTDDVILALATAAPEGELRATVTFTADNGSIAVVRVRSTIGRPPDIAAALDGCNVSARVEDETEIASVALHWRVARAEESARMRVDTSGGWTRELPATATSWWIRATDGLGNEGRTDERPLPAPAC